MLGPDAGGKGGAAGGAFFAFGAGGKGGGAGGGSGISAKVRLTQRVAAAKQLMGLEALQQSSPCFSCEHPAQRLDSVRAST